MVVELNGKATTLPDDATLVDAVVASGAGEDRGVAAAVDGEVVPKAGWAGRTLSEGDEVEVVRAVQGG